MVANPKHDEMKRHALEVLETLPTEAQAEVASFVEFQRYRLDHREHRDTPYRPVKLGGLWAGIRIDEEDIADVRKEMWGDFGDRDF